MKTINNILENIELLLEAQNYEAMFNRLYQFIEATRQEAENDPKIADRIGNEFKTQYNLDSIKSKVKQDITEAKSKLKKNDRIVWYLKILRMSILVREWNLIPDANSPVAQRIMAEVKRESNTFAEPNRVTQWAFAHTVSSSSMIVNSLAHYFSLPITAIQNTVFDKQGPFDILDTFREYEQEWEQKQSQVVTQQETHTIVLKFPDGKVWMDLETPSCGEEGKAMGHCGNQAAARPGDTILSLREPIKGQPEDKWRPLLTFILHENGYLGEMKGRGNKKPAPQYHKYIIDLLKQPFVKGITGGGYAPEENFSMNDLSEEQRDQLYKEKPELAPISYQYEATGMTKDLLEKLKTTLADSLSWFIPGDLVYDSETKTFKQQIELSELLKEEDGRNSRDNSISWMYDQVRGEGHPVFHEGGVSKDELTDMVDDFSERVKSAILDYVEKNHKEEYDDAIEEHDPNSHQDIKDACHILWNNDDELYDELRSAYSSGWESGTQSEIYDELDKTLTKWESEDGFYLTDIDFGDDKANLTIGEAALIRLASNTDDLYELDNYVGGWIGSKDAPHYYSRYGFSDFSAKDAEEYLLDNSSLLDEYLPAKEKTPEEKAEVEESLNQLRKLL